MNNEPVESIIYGSRYSAGRLSLVGRWIRAKEDPDIRVVRDRFEAFVRAGTVVTVAGVAVEDPAYENPADPLTRCSGNSWLFSRGALESCDATQRTFWSHRRVLIQPDSVPRVLSTAA